MLIFGMLSLILMVLDHRFHAIDAIRSTLSIVVDPIRYVVNVPSDIADWASGSLVSHSALEEENKTLKTQNRLLKSKLQNYADLKAENSSLRGLLNSAKKYEDKVDQVLIAEILSVDLDPFRRKVVINKGTSHNVYVGQPVIGAQGVMGKIIHIGPLSSTALMITDANHSIPVQVNRNNVRAIAMGIPKNNQLELIHQPNNADIKMDDLLVTSGLGCIFPDGYPVGRVVDITTNLSLPFAKITVEPTAQLDKNREVLLVWPDFGGNKQSDCRGPEGDS